jgi:hypothetical protein
MNSAEIARRFADKRPGYTIVSYGEVGLPFYRVRVRAQVLERKPIPPMEEIVMMAIDYGLDDREILRELLGLDKPFFEGVLAELVRKEHIRVGGIRADLELSDPGKQILIEAREIKAVDEGLEVHFDSLLRSVVPSVAGMVDARRIDSTGLREVPPAQRRPPELSDLDPDAIQRIALRVPGPDLESADLLAVKRIDRRTRAFRAGAILVYRGDERKEVQVAIALDGQLSAEHESAFAAARLTTKMGVRAAAMEEPTRLFEAVFERQLDASSTPSTEKTESGPEILACFDHPKLLRLAVEQPRKRLLVISPRITPEGLDPELLNSLRRRLVEGTEVYFGIGPERKSAGLAELDRAALRPLEAFYEGFRNFTLKRFSRPGPAILATDRDLAVLTRFNWLGAEGDPERNYVDERGLLLRQKELVDELFAIQTARF